MELPIPEFSLQDLPASLTSNFGTVVPLGASYTWSSSSWTQEENFS